MGGILKIIKESNKSLFVGVAGPGTGKSTAFKTIIGSDDCKGKKVLILSFIRKLINDLTTDFKDWKDKGASISEMLDFAKLRSKQLESNRRLFE